MSDVFKFRVTVDLEIATHEAPRTVREFLKTETAAALFAKQQAFEDAPGDVVERIHQFNVRAKRLDDWADIVPPVALHISQAMCPHCTTQFTDITVHELPFKCPVCGKTIPIDAEGKVRG